MLFASIRLPSWVPKLLGAMPCSRLCISGKFHDSGQSAGARLSNKVAACLTTKRTAHQARAENSAELAVLTRAQGEEKNERECYKMVPAQ